MAKIIIGRVAEKEILTNSLNSSRSELIPLNEAAIKSVMENIEG